MDGSNVFLRIMVACYGFRNAASVRFLVVLFDGGIPIRLRGPIAPFWPSFQNQTSINGMGGLYGGNVLFSFCFCLINDRLRSMTMVHVKSTTNDNSTSRAISNKRFIFFKFRQNGRDRENLGVIRIINVKSDICPVMPRARNVIGPTIYLNLSNVLFPTIRPTKDRVGKGGRNSRCRCRCVSYFRKNGSDTG